MQKQNKSVSNEIIRQRLILIYLLAVIFAFVTAAIRGLSISMLTVLIFVLFSGNLIFIWAILDYDSKAIKKKEIS